jgi:DNA-binding MarR family transcriptional regulator
LQLGGQASSPRRARRATIARMALLYRRTDAGRKAWDTQEANVPLEYRRVLGLFVHDNDPREVRAKLGWSEGALNDVLEELEEKGMLERYETDDRVDLDFTGSFSVAGLNPLGRA